MGNTTSAQRKPIIKHSKTSRACQVDMATGLPIKDIFLTIGEEIVNTGDTRWVLAMIDIDSLKKINETESRSAGDIIITTVGRAIYSFMQQNDELFKGFRSHDNGDEFYLFVHCRQGKKSFAEEPISQLVSKIENTTTATISVGLTYLKKRDTITDWEERAQFNMKHVKTKKHGNGFSWDVKRKKSKKKQTKTKTKNKSKKEKNNTNEEKKNESEINDWYNKYKLTAVRNKLIRDGNLLTLDKLYRIKDPIKVSEKLRFKFEDKIKFQTSVQCLKERSLILQPKEKRELRANITHKYDYIEMNEKSSLSITAKRGLLSIECFVLIMRKGSMIHMNGKGQINGEGEGGNVYGIAKMPALGQPRGGGGGGGFGANGDDGTVGKGGKIYGNSKLIKPNNCLDELEVLTGSAGGFSYNGDPHGEGGGGIKIVCLEKLILYDNASIVCNGTNGTAQSGGGSGGAIYLRSPEIIVMNKNKVCIEAIGGRGGKQGGGNGGDGRIAVMCNNKEFDVTNKNIKPAIGYKGKF